MVGFGRDLCGPSSPTLLPKQGHLQQAAQDRVQAGVEYLQRRRLHNLPGQPVPVLRRSQREEVLGSITGCSFPFLLQRVLRRGKQTCFLIKNDSRRPGRLASPCCVGDRAFGCVFQRTFCIQNTWYTSVIWLCSCTHLCESKRSELRWLIGCC